MTEPETRTELCRIIAEVVYDNPTNLSRATEAADAILARFTVTEKPREKTYDELLDEWEETIAQGEMNRMGVPRDEAYAIAREYIQQYRRPCGDKPEGLG